MTQSLTSGALKGVRIVEAASGLAAAYCGKLLADLGADVIKVEPTGGGDPIRRMGPFRGDLPDQEGGGLHLFLNANKRGATLNLRQSAGARLLGELLSHAELLITTPGNDIDLDTLQAANPHLAVVSITPFGRTGPYSLYQGGRLIASHASGVAYMNPAEGVTDLKSEPPLQAPAEFAEFTIGITAALASMAAILNTQLGVTGKSYDVSEQEALANTVRTEMAAATYEKEQVARVKMRKRSGGMLYRCKDGYFVMSATGDGFWPALVNMMGGPTWTQEEWCQTSVLRHQNIERVNARIDEWASAYAAKEIEVMAIEHRIPFGIVQTVAALDSDAQLAERNFYAEVPHPAGGTLRVPGAPYKLSGTPWAIYRPAPRTGEHNTEIYCDLLGYDRATLVRMRQSDVI